MNQNNIKPQELRIGNWVQYDNRYFQIDSIAEVFPTLNTDEFGIGVVDYNNIKPIPLSEEVLLKAGFIKDGFQDIYVSFTKGNIKLWHDVKKNVFTVDGLKFLNVKVSSFHQLQNLFYSLTGEELEVKL